jgi:hypothetical protein
LEGKYSFSAFRPADRPNLENGMDFRDIVTWDALPDKLVEGEEYSLKVRLDGSYKSLMGQVFNRKLNWALRWTTPEEYKIDNTGGILFWDPVRLSGTNGVDSLEVKFTCPKHDDPTAKTVLVIIDVQEYSKARYVYEYTRGTSSAPAVPVQPPAVVTTNMTSQIAPPQPRDQRLDNQSEPAKEGGPGTGAGSVPVGKIEKKPSKEDHEKTAKNAQDWYNHAQKVYRFVKAQGWSVALRQPGGDTDLLLPPDEGIALVCGRGSGSAGSESAERVLDRLAAGVVQKNPGAMKSVFRLGDAPAVRIETYDSKERSMLWHIYFVHGSNSYYFAIAMPPGTGRVPLPNQVMNMLNTIEFLK